MNLINKNTEQIKLFRDLSPLSSSHSGFDHPSTSLQTPLSVAAIKELIVTFIIRGSYYLSHQHYFPSKTFCRDSSLEDSTSLLELGAYLDIDLDLHNEDQRLGHREVC
mmetsp:Transcript_19617/g.21306  ORF Transcript_19617/g.21306 Transcript_19617/m.21306 type:complete len:108 (-) Transcript_19617:1075-1398(-)